MSWASSLSVSSNVALLTEGVDRNRAVAQRPQHHAVALLTEGVDRNSAVEMSSCK